MLSVDSDLLENYTKNIYTFLVILANLTNQMRVNFKIHMNFQGMRADNVKLTRICLVRFARITMKRGNIFYSVITQNNTSGHGVASFLPASWWLVEE